MKSAGAGGVSRSTNDWQHGSHDDHFRDDSDGLIRFRKK